MIEIHPVRYVYVLLSKKDNRFYVVYTDNLKRRLMEHNDCKVPSTKYRLPLILVYYEACLNQHDSTQREKYLKTAWGKRYIKNRIKHFLLELRDDK